MLVPVDLGQALALDWTLAQFQDAVVGTGGGAIEKRRQSKQANTGLSKFICSRIKKKGESRG
jgi:hypothetical protein